MPKARLVGHPAPSTTSTSPIVVHALINYVSALGYPAGALYRNSGPT
jgi:hypothetical protein